MKGAACDRPGGCGRASFAPSAERLWVVIVARRPRSDARALRDLLRALRAHGARRVAAGVHVVRDAAGLREALREHVDRIERDQGRVIVADSRSIDRRADT